MGFEPAIREAARQDFSQQRFPTRLVAISPPAQIGGEIAVGRKVEMNGFNAVPVRRDLDHSGPADALMREELVFGERLFRAVRPAASGSTHFGGASRQIAPALAVP